MGHVAAVGGGHDLHGFYTCMYANMYIYVCIIYINIYVCKSQYIGRVDTVVGDMNYLNFMYVCMCIYMYVHAYIYI